jgi:hypothetical protein
VEARFGFGFMPGIAVGVALPHWLISRMAILMGIHRP